MGFITQGQGCQGRSQDYIRSRKEMLILCSLLLLRKEIVVVHRLLLAIDICTRKGVGWARNGNIGRL